MDYWPHAPLHWFKGEGNYILTGGTYLKQKFFTSDSDLDYLQDLMFDLAKKKQTSLRSWSFFPNHYHVVVESPPQASRLRELVREFHSITAHEINRRANSRGRKVWYQYWDTYLDDERAYLSRLNYVNQNPVHHGIVRLATNYRWCSAAWFEANAKRSFLETLREFDETRVSVKDDF
jgi:putative transposase